LAVPNKPVEGVAIVKAPATVTVAADDVVDPAEIELPLLIEFVTTTVYEPASLVVTVLNVIVVATSPLIVTPSLRHWYDKVPVSGDAAVTDSVAD
jgi:hypothetical protein